MDRRRLKTVMILILLLADAFLLTHLAVRYGGEAAERHQADEALLTLLAEDGISLSAVPRKEPPEPIRLSGYEKQEEAAAAFFLGVHVNGMDTEDGRLYTQDKTEVRFFGQGAFTVSGLESVQDPQKLCRRFCRAFGFRLPAETAMEDGVLMAGAVCEGVSVENCHVSFLFSEGTLREVSGILLPGESGRSGNTEPLRSAAAALTAFQLWEERPKNIVIIEIKPCFIMESQGDDACVLTPAWRIEAENATACVHCVSGEVFAA